MQSMKKSLVVLQLAYSGCDSVASVEKMTLLFERAADFLKSI